MTIYTFHLPTVFILAGLDVGRFEFITATLALQILAWAGLFMTGALILWTVTANIYLSCYARIQDDRDQQVIATGPYRFIRHPMYLGIIV